MENSSTAVFSDPELRTDAWTSGSVVVTVPIRMVAAAPSFPIGPISPFSPFGMLNCRIASCSSPIFLMVAASSGLKGRT
ncbi:hypothetical protein, partial [Commensalibacter sp. M0266]|uniref:hypothetical protein n=1 Tax=Commensalibacter sp. M0266 TaxID=2750948 RepID=UPI001E3A0224